MEATTSTLWATSRLGSSSSSRAPPVALAPSRPARSPGFSPAPPRVLTLGPSPRPHVIDQAAHAPHRRYILLYTPFIIIGALTLTLLEDYSISTSVMHVDRDVMHHIEKEHVEAGDFVRAADLVRADLDRTTAQPLDHATLSQKITDMIKLAEMFWRYRVVEEGQSPRDEAIQARAPRAALSRSVLLPLHDACATSSPPRRLPSRADPLV